jgi:hypothetical protein
MKFGDVSKFASPFCVAKFSSIYSLRSSLFIKRERVLRLHQHMSSPCMEGIIPQTNFTEILSFHQQFFFMILFEKIIDFQK